MEINEDHPNKDKQRLFSQSLLMQGSLPPLPALGRDSEAIMGVEALERK